MVTEIIRSEEIEEDFEIGIRRENKQGVQKSLRRGRSTGFNYLVEETRRT